MFDLITARSDLPVIGHNCLLDLLHMTHQFDNGPPSNVVEFCSQLRQLFPAGIYDTKLIASYLKENDTALGPSVVFLKKLFFFFQ